MLWLLLRSGVNPLQKEETASVIFHFLISRNFRSIDMGFVAKERDSEIHCGDRPIILTLRFHKLHHVCPVGFTPPSNPLSLHLYCVVWGPLFNVKETSLLHLPFTPINPEEMESQRVYQNQRFFRTLQVLIEPKQRQPVHIHHRLMPGYP